MIVKTECQTVSVASLMPGVLPQPYDTIVVIAMSSLVAAALAILFVALALAIFDLKVAWRAWRSARDQPASSRVSSRVSR